jgi:uncharacterized protein YggE
MDTTFDIKKYTWLAGTLALAGLFIMSLAIAGAQLSSMKHPVGQQGTISVSGDGEVTVKPDIATVTITVRESAPTVADAQSAVEKKVVAAINALAQFGVSEEDRKTTSYNVNPKYENVPVETRTMVMYPVTNQKIVGYEASQTVEIKIRKIDSAGDVVGALGAANISEISGPNFTVENPDAVQAKAKELAIKEARDKAKATAKALGVDLGDVVQYSEDQGGYYPMMYSKAAPMDAGGSLGAEVTLPTGENTVKSHVTITYNLD